jgi:hypothetical protein
MRARPLILYVIGCACGAGPALTRAETDYAEAKRLYQRNDQRALPALKQIALASPDDPEHCGVASGLVLDLLSAAGGEGLVEFQLEFQHSECANDERTVAALGPKLHRLAPPRIGLPSDSTDPVLTALGFLEGCWSYYDVDYGYELCFHAADGRVVGDVRTIGPMASPAWFGLTIARDDAGWMLSAAPGFTELAGFERVPLLEANGSSAAFGVTKPALQLEAAGTGLKMIRGRTLWFRRSTPSSRFEGISRW